MSPTKPDLRKWPFNWLFSKDKFTSIDPILLVRQQLAKFILDLGTNLKMYVSHLFILSYLKIIYLDLIDVFIQRLCICIDF
jgi:hypothetical protein